MQAILERRFVRVEEKDLGEDGLMIAVRFEDWKGSLNPAREAAGTAVG